MVPFIDYIQYAKLCRASQFHISTKLLAYVLIYNKSTLQLVQVIFDFHYVSKYLIISLKMINIFIIRGTYTIAYKKLKNKLRPQQKMGSFY